MAGYSRQSVADIIANAVIKAAPVNAEYNAIRDAFAFSGGHKHDGSSTEGAYVPLIADTDALNKVVIDTANNRIGVFVEVSAAAVEQIRIQDGAILPVTDNDIDLGASGTKFKNLYVNGIASIGSITLSGGTIDNTVIGGTTPAAADFTTMDASGNATVGGTFGVTGNTTIGGTLGVTGVTTLGTANITSADVNSGSIDGTTIGAVTPAAGTFTTLTANTSLTAATADINGGTLDGVTIGATSAAAATVTDLTASGTSTLTTVDINGGTIDGTTIGASSAAAGSFTTVSTSGQATLATADINGGTVDNTVIGATTPAAITGTTITGTSFVGPVTGNVTGNLTGNVTGNVTGDVTGNITSSGSSSFNNVTIDGTLNMNAGTTATITNLTSPTNTNDAATKGYVDTSISNLVDSAPGTLDTLNELAAALGDDPNFSTTITNSIATKLPLAGGTMTGAIAMSTNKITGLGDPTAAQDAVTKSYAEANFLDLTGGTMTGAIDMGSAKITSTYAPTNAADLTNKTYVDAILGSGQDATAAAAAAATSEANAATSETNAANSATAAASSATSAAASYDSFDDRYLGAKATAPTVDNDGDALINGALYFNTTTNIMYVYGSSGWQAAGSSVNGTSDRQTYTATAGQTVFAATYDAGYVDVYLNGVKLLAGTDFTATNGTSITLASGAAVNDIVDIVAYGTFVLADHYTKTQSDARYVDVAGDTMTGNLDVQGTVTADGLTVQTTNGLNAVLEGTTSYQYLQFKNSGETENYLGFVNDDFTVTAGNTKYLQVEGNGDISFYEGTGTTAKFFWDASAESLGIGTTSPQAKLDVSDVSNFSVGYNTFSGDGLHIQCNGTGGNGAYAGGISFSRISSDNNSRAAGIAAVQTTADADQVGLAFFTHSSATTSADLIEAMRIDSSGNLLVNSTSISVTSSGSHFGAYGSSANSSFVAQSDGAVTGYINRNTSDGELLRFSKSGTTVGSIGVYSGDITVGNGDVGLIFNDAVGLISPWDMTANAVEDNAIDLGYSAGRFKDLYLSGGTKYGSSSDFGQVRKTGGELQIDSYGTGGARHPIKFTQYTTEVGRFDSSGNLLVGKTSSAVGTAGHELLSYGRAVHTVNASTVQIINRLSNDGDMTIFQKDGTTVGSIGVADGDNLVISSTVTGHAGFKFSDTTVTPWVNNTNSDNAMDIGAGPNRFKDLYLSGGVYLGGTGAANKLDDYEEGTFSPSLAYSSNGTMSVTYNATDGYYTKIGRFVHFKIELRLATFTKGTASGNLLISGLPFTSNNINGRGGHENVSIHLYNSPITQTDGNFPIAQVFSNSTQIALFNMRNNNSFENMADPTGAAQYKISGTYFTA